MPTIRIDDEVYAWLKSLATPFEDNPNSVLRRVAGVHRDGAKSPDRKAEPVESNGETGSNGANDRLSGKILSRKWNVKVLHALYHREGTFYENLRRFPGALFDPNGYIVFNREDEYLRSPYLEIGRKLNVPNGIASIPAYRRIR